jgi:hypothetical protein
LLAVALLALSYRVARVFGADELRTLASVPIPLAGPMARFLGAER